MKANSGDTNQPQRKQSHTKPSHKKVTELSHKAQRYTCPGCHRPFSANEWQQRSSCPRCRRLLRQNRNQPRRDKPNHRYHHAARQTRPDVEVLPPETAFDRQLARAGNVVNMTVKHPLIGASGVALSGSGMIIAGQAISAFGSGITTFGMVVTGLSAVGMVVGGTNDKTAAPTMFKGITAGIGMSVAGSVMAVAGQVISIGGAVTLGGSGCLAGYGIIKTYAENKHRLHWGRNAEQIHERAIAC